jgi:tRNA(Ile)-lysidine synthase
VVPVLKELNSGLLSSFQNTLENLNQSQSLVEDAANLVYEKVVHETDNQLKINIKELLNYSNFKAYLYQWLKGYEFTAWDDIYELVTAQSGKQVFSESYLLLKDREVLILAPREDKGLEEYEIGEALETPVKFSFCNVNNISNSDSNCIFVDEDALQFPLTIRKWKEGDYFYPIGMQGKKKLSKYYKDEKYSLIDKSNQWLLCSNNQIVWVIKKRQDDRFKITENTINKLQIKLQ